MMMDARKADVWGELKLDIPNTDSNFCVCYPEKPMTHEAFQTERAHITMGISNVGHGAGGTAIGFFTEKEWTGSRDTNALLQSKIGFGFYVEKATLLAMKRAIDFAVENYLD